MKNSPELIYYGTVITAWLYIKEFLELDYYFTITEITEISLSLSLSLSAMNVFQFNKNSAKQLRSGNHLQRTNIQTVYFGSQYITALGANISDLISAEIKTSKSLNTFKKW